jgi:hypothetical protein
VLFRSCICATNMGMYACSETNSTTVNACTMLLCMYSGVIDVIAMNKGMNLNIACGNLAGIGVSLYQVSACMFGVQHIALAFGPNAIHLDTNQAHRLAEITNNKFMYNRLYLNVIY